MQLLAQHILSQICIVLLHDLHIAGLLIDSLTSESAGVCATIAILSGDNVLIESTMNDLADEAIVNFVTPNLPLLAVLLERGLFSNVAESLQLQLLNLLQKPATPPSLLQTSDSAFPVAQDSQNADFMASSIMLPASIFLLVSQGCYAQASGLCMYHVKYHDAFKNVESGLKCLALYVSKHQEALKCSPESPQPADWPVPQTILKLSSALVDLLTATTNRMRTDSFDISH